MESQWELDFRHYCNYPEVSKSRKTLQLDSEELSISSNPSSSDLPRLNSAVSDPRSQLNIFVEKKESLSLCNRASSFLSSQDSDIGENLCSTISESSTDYDDSSSFFECIPKKENYYYTVQLSTDPSGWIKYASDMDPWNKENYTDQYENTLIPSDGVLIHELVSKCSKKLDQLPDNKAFVFTRLHINRKGLEDISILSSYKYFQYIDVSWNYLSSLDALRNFDYLMYLNASHNKLTAVLDFRPPWFLTHVNLSCNEIKQIGQNLSNFWSLRYIDLSYNAIEFIEGLSNLKYLKYLDLSHNHIKQIENLDCVNLEEFNLQFNEISDNDIEGAGLQVLNYLKELDLSHNKLSSLIHFKELYSLKKLDISYNHVTGLNEADNLTVLVNLDMLNMIGNSLTLYPAYREFILYKLANLKVLDCIEVKCSEKVAAKMLFEPDICTRTHHLRSKIELWNQLAAQEINTTILPSDEPPVPVVIIVGTFANQKENIAKKLVLELPDQVYRFKKYTTMPEANNFDPEDLISISMDEFNGMIKSGQFIFYYKEIGFFFGLCRDELCKCIIHGKIGLIDTVFEAAMVMRTSGYQPYMVISIMENVQNYMDILSSHYMKLWSSFQANISSTVFDNDSKNMDSEKEEPEAVHDTSSCNTDSMASNASMQDLYSTISSDQQLEYKSKHGNKSVKWHMSIDLLAEVNDEDIDQAGTQMESFSDEFTGWSVSDEFVWSWSMDSSSAYVEPEPDEKYINMIKGKEKFVSSTVQLQDMYLEMHNSHPGLFTSSVLTDDIDGAVKNLKKLFYNIAKNSFARESCDNIKENPICKQFVNERVTYLMHDFLNISTYLQYNC